MKRKKTELNDLFLFLLLISFKSIAQQSKMAVLGQQFVIPGTTEKVRNFLFFLIVTNLFQ